MYEDTGTAAGPGQQPSSAAAFPGPPWALLVTTTGVFNRYNALRHLLLQGENFVGCQQQPHTLALPLWDLGVGQSHQLWLPVLAYSKHTGPPRAADSANCCMWLL